MRGYRFRKGHMTNSGTTSDQVLWTLEGLLDLFEPTADGENRFIAQTGLAGADDRQVVEGTQVLAQTLEQIEAELQKHPAAFPELVVTSSEKGRGIETLLARPHLSPYRR